MYGRASGSRTLQLAALVTAGIAAALACAPTSSVDAGRTGDGGGGNSSNGGTGSGSASSSGTGSGGDDIGFGSSINAPVDNDAGCAEYPSAAEQVTTTVTHEVTHDVTTYSPLDMYIMYDQSGSMNDDTPVGTRWDAVKAALTGFVNDPTTGDIGVGIGYFPYVNPAAPPICFTDPDCGAFGPCVPVLFVGYCQGADACLPSQYSTPDVPITLLPGAATAIVNSLNSHNPGGGTPTRPALEGAHIYAAQWAAAHPERTTIVVLATDGNPSGCATNGVNDVANIAANALAANPSVPTFVVGVGSSLTSLNAIAAAGGSTEAIVVDDQSGDPTQQFIEALKKIRDEVTTSVTETVTEEVTETIPVQCEWQIPTEMPPGITFVKEEVNVKFQAGASGTPQVIGGIGSESECAGVEGGWYYDNYDLPTKVLVCPQTCTAIQAIQDARVNVVFGCETEPAVPR